VLGVTYEERFDLARACLKQLRKRAADARQEADRWVGEGERPDGVSYEMLDRYALGLEDAVGIMSSVEAT
jgi:hypothetical protein